jgi:hypothetical protein
MKPAEMGRPAKRRHTTVWVMDALPWFLLSLVSVCFFFFLLFWVVRAAVAHGIEDAALRREQARQDEISFAQDAARQDGAV